MTPNWRNLAGIAVLLIGLVVYAGLVMNLAEKLGPMPLILEVAYYIFFGVIWIFPCRWLFLWMARGKHEKGN